MDIRAISFPYTKSATMSRATKDETAQSRLQSAKATLSMMIEAQKEQGDNAKTTAKQKVEQLKERLRMLQQMFSGDPEKLAKLLAQLSKELKAAVKSYAATGGAMAGLDTAATPQPGAPPSDGANSGVSADIDLPAMQATTTDEAPPDAKEAVTDGTEPPPHTNPYTKSAEAQKTEEKQAEAKADADFAKDVRDLMRKIKALLERAKAEAETKTVREDKDNPTQDAFSEVDTALKSLNEEVSDLEQSSGQALFTTGLRISLNV